MTVEEYSNLASLAWAVYCAFAFEGVLRACTASFIGGAGYAILFQILVGQ